MSLASRSTGDVPKESVVVLGAGYAGLRTALGLSREPSVTVTLVDRERTPVVKTRMHELRRHPATTDVDRVLSRTDVRFVEGSVIEIDRARKQILLADRAPLPYDRLVVALGSRTTDRGVPGARAHAVMLDGAVDAERLSRAVRQLKHTDAPLVVVGAGPTGVEAAAEASRRLGRGRVVLLNADEKILRGFSRAPRAYATAALMGLGVRVRNRAAVTKVETSRLHLADGTIVPFGALLWSAGVEPSPLLSASSLAGTQQQAQVDEHLVSVRDGDIYIVGDCADANNGEPSAQLAVQQGDFVADDIIRDIRGLPRRHYKPAILGQFVSLGCDATGALQLGRARFPLFGPFASVAKSAGETRHRLVVAARAGGLPDLARLSYTPRLDRDSV